MSFLKKIKPPIKMSENVIAHLRFCLSKFLSNDWIFKDLATNDLQKSFNQADFEFLESHRLLGYLMLGEEYWKQQAVDFELSHFFDQIYPKSYAIPTFIKGSDTSRSIWKDPGFRKVSDWDICLGHHDFQTLNTFYQENRQNLLSAGYLIEMIQDQDQIISLHVRKKHLLIEFHHHLIPSYLIGTFKKIESNQQTSFKIDSFKIDAHKTMMQYGLNREINCPTPESRWRIFLINQAKNGCQGFDLQDLIEYVLILIHWQQELKNHPSKLGEAEIFDLLIQHTSLDNPHLNADDVLIFPTLYRLHLIILDIARDFLQMINLAQSDLLFIQKYIDASLLSHTKKYSNPIISWYFHFLSNLVKYRLNHDPLNRLGINIPNILITLCFWHHPLSYRYYVSLWLRCFRFKSFNQ